MDEQRLAVLISIFQAHTHVTNASVTRRHLRSWLSLCTKPQLGLFLDSLVLKRFQKKQRSTLQWLRETSGDILSHYISGSCEWQRKWQQCWLGCQLTSQQTDARGESLMHQYCITVTHVRQSSAPTVKGNLRLTFWSCETVRARCRLLRACVSWKSEWSGGLHSEHEAYTQILFPIHLKQKWISSTKRFSPRGNQRSIRDSRSLSELRTYDSTRTQSSFEREKRGNLNERTYLAQIYEWCCSKIKTTLLPDIRNSTTNLSLNNCHYRPFKVSVVISYCRSVSIIANTTGPFHTRQVAIRLQNWTDMTPRNFQIACLLFLAWMIKLALQKITQPLLNGMNDSQTHFKKLLIRKRFATVTIEFLGENCQNPMVVLRQNWTSVEAHSDLFW